MAKTKFYACAVAIFLLAAMPLTAQAPSLTEVYAQIKAEETNNSKIMWIIHEIADVYGPRLTGTPDLKHADDWAVQTMTSWGLKNAHLEPWTFQPPSAAVPAPGWENMELLADAVSPFHGQLMVKPLAWTPSTKGVQTATVVMLMPPGMAERAAGAEDAEARAGGVVEYHRQLARIRHGRHRLCRLPWRQRPNLSRRARNWTRI